MLDSWQKDRKNRPKFPAVRNTIDRLMQSPDLLRKLAKPITSAMMDPEMSDAASHMTVSQWLQLIKMDKYTEAFAQKGVHNMEQVKTELPLVIYCFNYRKVITRYQKIYSPHNIIFL